MLLLRYQSHNYHDNPQSQCQHTRGVRSLGEGDIADSAGFVVGYNTHEQDNNTNDSIECVHEITFSSYTGPLKLL